MNTVGAKETEAVMPRKSSSSSSSKKSSSKKRSSGISRPLKKPKLPKIRRRKK